jgi:hypothetical protein
MGRPVSAILLYVFSVPRSSKADFSIATRNENALPLNFRQSVQWHTPTNTGSLEAL